MRDCAQQSYHKYSIAKKVMPAKRKMQKKIGKKNDGQVRILIVDNDMRLSGRLWISFSH